MKSLSEKVWNGEMKRPSISKDWAPTIKTLLEQMWTPAFRTRPDFPTVTETLRKEIVQLRGGDDEGGGSAGVGVVVVVGVNPPTRRRSYVGLHCPSNRP